MIYFDKMAHNFCSNLEPANICKYGFASSKVVLEQNVECVCSDYIANWCVLFIVYDT